MKQTVDIVFNKKIVVCSIWQRDNKDVYFYILYIVSEFLHSLYYMALHTNIHKLNIIMLSI